MLFDVGANKGEYSRTNNNGKWDVRNFYQKTLAAQFKESRIYSFEKLPSTFKTLTKSVQDLNNIVCINNVLGSQVEDRLFYTEGS